MIGELPLANILVASQDEILRDLLELSLQRLEHFVRLSESGDQSLKMIRDDFFYLALFDYEMPDMTAVEILKTLKNSYGNVPLAMILSSDISPDTVKECISSGARDFVVKPFIIPDLILRMEKILKAANLL